MAWPEVRLETDMKGKALATVWDITAALRLPTTQKAFIKDDIPPSSISSSASAPGQRTFCSYYAVVKGTDRQHHLNETKDVRTSWKICKFVDNYFISLQVPPPSEGLLSLCHTLKVIFWWYSLPGLLSKEAAQSVVTGMIKHESWALLLEQINQIWLGRKFCTELPGDIGNKKPSISG